MVSPERLVARARRTFPLVPRPRAAGLAYGTLPSRRRGQGTEVAGSRRYIPGDRLSWIDWNASARESIVRDEDVFIVRQFFAELAPRVLIVVDRAPSLGLYPPDLPWLSKPAAIREAATAILAAASAARAYTGYLEFSDSAYWIPPQRQRIGNIVSRLNDDFDSAASGLEHALEYLLRHPSDAPEGTFVFVLSDYLRLVSDTIWSHARALRWDLVPVIIQDPVWEQSFPDVGGLVLPVFDPIAKRRAVLRLSAREARERRRTNAVRLERLVDGFRRFGFDPVVLGTSDPLEIDAAFLAWARRRRLTRRRAR